ncbi:hypothetical protein GINT2_001923 [Glugoides intestinalis]
MLFLVIFLQLVLTTILQPGEMIEVDTTKASKIQLCMGVDNQCYMSAYDPQTEVWSMPKRLRETNPRIANEYVAQPNVISPSYTEEEDIIIRETRLIPAPCNIKKEVVSNKEEKNEIVETAEVAKVAEKETTVPVQSNKTKQKKAKNSALNMHITSYLLLLLASLIAI